MQKPQMIENQKDFCCSKGQKLPVVTITLDPKFSRNQRLLCKQCQENTDIDGKAIGLKKMISLIEENQVKKMEKVENIIYNELLDGFRIQQRSICSQNSFFEELEIMVLKSNQTGSKIHVSKRFRKLISVGLQSSQKYTEKYQQQQIKKKNMIQSINQSNVKTFNYQLVQECSISQSGWCSAIPIDKDCSTLLAGCESLIQVFEFNQGMIKQIQYKQIIVIILCYNSKSIKNLNNSYMVFKDIYRTIGSFNLPIRVQFFLSYALYFPLQLKMLQILPFQKYLMFRYLLVKQFQ
ncbi:unnamed protein product [Paramecium pentaurelia]|uniref:Uncharacterized protein n=1 Tax=Paramecium pentaurelia TaxID=43138 RepID=A0A8S1S289_9CILI|nr:unnamed protein product [Paramecium pentaurelia]